MKKLYTTALFIFSLFAAHAQNVNQLLKDSDISNSKSWSKNRFPISGDTVLIPAEAVYTIKEDVDFSKQDVYVKIDGKVILEKATIKLSYNSQLVLTSKTASINANNGKGTSIIFVGSDQKYKGSDGLEIGPAYINNTVSSFTEMTFNALPVKFIGFSVARSEAGINIQWATSEEVNASHYQVERSEDGINWKAIANVLAAGNSTVVHNYAYTDRTVVSRIAYYRIRQVDVDGRFAYTAVKTIGGTQTAAAEKVSISSTTTSHVLIQFTQAVKTPVQVRIVSLNGQVVSQQEYKWPGSQIVLQNTGAAKGAYIVCLSDGASLKVARQVML